MEDMAEIKRLIETLESDEGYFGMVQTISTEKNVTLQAAFCEVETIRSHIGLRHRFTSVESFYVGRHKHHHSGGEISRFIEPD